MSTPLTDANDVSHLTPPDAASAAAAMANLSAISFDFETKVDETIPATAAPNACAQGKFCWFDVDESAGKQGAVAILHSLGVNELAIREAIGPDVDGRHDLYDECLHIAVTSAEFVDDVLVKSHVDIVIGERFLFTLRRGKVSFIEQVRGHYKRDFQKFARSPSFLLYEYFDSLIESYKKTMRQVASRVETMQEQIFGEVGDELFSEVAGVTRDLLSFRKIMLAVREVLHELSTRRSVFVAETTQPFLERMVATLERLGSDLSVEREILAESLNLYMGIVSHRTNKVVNRLTVLSMIFLPLTFLCGVYGMNFDPDVMMPELKWRYGYTAFWIIAIVISSGMLIFMKRRKWI